MIVLPDYRLGRRPSRGVGHRVELGPVGRFPQTTETRRYIHRDHMLMTWKLARQRTDGTCLLSFWGYQIEDPTAIPAARASASALSVRSHGTSISSRPK